jgi:hypothetical protein
LRDQREMPRVSRYFFAWMFLQGPSGKKKSRRA